MMKRIYFSSGFLLVLTGILYNACVKAPDYPLAPVIKYIGTSRPSMKQGSHLEDSVTVRFSYTDGDGDLGFPGDDATPSIFIRDDRDSFNLPSLKLPYVEPQGAGNGINGEISIVVHTVCCIEKLPGGQKLACKDVTRNTDTVHYLIKIRDRAGHISNEIKTDPIVLICH
jgi:hypothetical protein